MSYKAECDRVDKNTLAWLKVGIVVTFMNACHTAFRGEVFDMAWSIIMMSMTVLGHVSLKKDIDRSHVQEVMEW